MKKTIILDNGAYEIKAGLAGTKPSQIPNCVARSKGDRRVYIGDQLRNCKDYGGLGFRRAFDRGYLTSWETEKAIWDTLFFDGETKIDPSETSLVVTEPVLDLPILQASYDQIVFEEYEFHSYFRTTAASLVPWQKDVRGALPMSECVLVVDSGFSFTHVVPVYNGKVIWSAVKRLNIGGKFLTNHLKEVISYRHYNMMDETYLINKVKETCCFVSQNFSVDLENVKHKRQGEIKYVLPDYSNSKEGYVLKEGATVKEDQQVLVLGNERFSIPEILFTPGDVGTINHTVLKSGTGLTVGSKQGGIAEAVIQAVNASPEELRSMLLANIVLTGGNSKLPGFLDRLEKEIRSMAPASFVVRFIMPTDPITCAWDGGSTLASDKKVYTARIVTRKEYMEHGSNICSTRFDTPRGLQEGITEDTEMY